MQNLDAYKQDLLALKKEYQSRIDKISDHISNPKDQLQQHWDDQAVAASRDEMRKALLIEAEQGLTRSMVHYAVLSKENTAAVLNVVN